MPLVNAKKMVKKAYKDNWAVPHININNLEWTKAILITAQENKSPVILGTSIGAIRYMGGMKTVCQMVSNLIDYYKISVPVALHLDHGSFENVLEALEAGYTSVMYDGSSLPIKKNLEITKKVITKAKEKNASVEVEVGAIGGSSYGIFGQGELANPDEVLAISKLKPDIIAPGINNFHGQYPKDWKSLNFKILRKLRKLSDISLSLHGGSGIPADQVKKSISMGIAKVNVNTELQLANAYAIRKFIRSGKSEEGKNYDPRILLNPGYLAIKETIKQKMKEFGSINKA